MKHKIIYLSIFLLSFFSYSCEDLINENNKKEFFILHALVNEGETPKIVCSKTLEAFPKYPFNVEFYDQPFYNNLEIKVSSSDGKVFNNFTQKEIALNNSDYNSQNKISDQIIYYVDSNFVAEAGKEYKIEIIERSEKIISHVKSQTTIPSNIPLSFAQDKDVLNTGITYLPEDEKYYNQVYNLSFDDPKNEKDYYYLTLSTVALDSDFNMNEVNMNDLWNNNNQTQDTYYWHNNLKLYNAKISGIGNSNQNNYVSGDEMQGYLFTDESFDGSLKNIRIELINYGYNEPCQFIVAELFHVTEEFYWYYYTQQQQHQTQLDVFTEPTQIFSNVEDGLGVFAGTALTTSYLKVIPKP